MKSKGPVFADTVLAKDGKLLRTMAAEVTNLHGLVLREEGGQEFLYGALNKGGKVVKLDRVEWISMPDQMTAVNALLNGEVDFMQQVPFDLLPMLLVPAAVAVTAVRGLRVPGSVSVWVS